MTRAIREAALVGMFLLSVMATESRADRRELTVGVTIAPAWISLDDPLTGTATTQQLGGSIEFLGSYGLSNWLSVGASIRGIGTPGASFLGVLLPDPSNPNLVVTVVEDQFAVALSALVQFRFDTGYALAPIARFEAGGCVNRFVNLYDLPPNNPPRSHPSQTELVPSFRGLIGLEYRFAEKWIASIGLRYGRSLNTFSRWQIDLPIGVAFLW